MKKNLCFFVVLLSFVFLWENLSGQAPVLRTEIEVLENELPFTVFNLGEKGLMVVMDQNDLKMEGSYRHIFFYDKYLQALWRSTYQIKGIYTYISYTLNHDTAYFILSSLPASYKEYPFVLLKVSLSDGNHQLYHLEPSESVKEEIVSATYEDHQLLYISKEKKHYYLSNFLTTSSTVQRKEIADNQSELCSVHYDTIFEKIYVLFRDKDLKKSYLTLKVFDYQLQRLGDYKIAIREMDCRITDAQMIFAGDEKLWIGGCFGLLNEKIQTSSYDRAVNNAGLFSLLWEKGNIRSSALKNYSDFRHVDTLLSVQAAYQMKESKEKSSKKNAVSSYTSAFYLRQTEKMYFVMAEVFERKETMISEMYYDAYGRMIPYSRTIFDGYEFKDAFYWALDSAANSVADWIMDISNSAKISYLGRMSDFYCDKEGAFMAAYNQESFISYQAFSPNKALSPGRFRLEMPQGDKIEKTWGNHIFHAYKDVWMAYGYQQIYNPTQSKKGKRNVFYISRLKAE